MMLTSQGSDPQLLDHVDSVLFQGRLVVLPIPLLLLGEHQLHVPRTFGNNFSEHFLVSFGEAVHLAPFLQGSHVSFDFALLIFNLFLFFLFIGFGLLLVLSLALGGLLFVLLLFVLLFFVLLFFVLLFFVLLLF